MKYMASTNSPDYEEQGTQDRLERPEPRPARPFYRAHAPYQPHPRDVYPDTHAGVLRIQRSIRYFLSVAGPCDPGPTE
jgi:hypothetical protein